MNPESRPSRTRSALGLLAAAAVLVAGADTVAFAATGDSLLLGKSNKSSKTTTVKSAKGPALSLKTKENAPPLAVSSTRVVKKLNADLLDGLDPSVLEPPLQRLTVVAPDQAIDGSGVYRSFTLPAGTYEVLMRGAVGTVSNTDSFQCLFVDVQKYLGGDLTGVYGYVSSNEGSEVISDSAVFTTSGGRELVAGCSGSTDAYAVLPVELAIRKVRATSTVPSTAFAPRQAARLSAGAQDGLR